MRWRRGRGAGEIFANGIIHCRYVWARVIESVRVPRKVNPEISAGVKRLAAILQIADLDATNLRYPPKDVGTRVPHRVAVGS